MDPVVEVNNMTRWQLDCLLQYDSDALVGKLVYDLGLVDLELGYLLGMDFQE